MRVFAVDVVAIVLFALLGRRNHGEESTLAGVIVVAGPFLIAWTLAWFVTKLHEAPGSTGEALRALIVALPVALVLRVVTDRGIAPAFILVAVVFLGVVLVGRRALVAWFGSRRRPPAEQASAPPAGS